MDLWFPFTIFFALFFLFCLCGACVRKRRNNNGAIFSTPVVVTSATHQLPPGAANYPVTVAQGTNQTSYPIQQGPPPPGVVPYPTYAMPQQGYPPMPQPAGPNPPYPMQQQQQMPYPPMQQQQQYPGQFVAGPQFNPPTYDQVVAGGGVAQSTYQKQSPYNPGYSGN